MKHYITYLRVSTARQGASGLGLEAQRTAVLNCIAAERGELLAEVIEIESGKADKRPKLAEALDLCKRTGATLLIARLDRLSRNVVFLFQLKDSGVDIKAADLPDLNTLTLGMLAVMAQHERERIAERTKAALDETLKRRGGRDWRTGKRKDGSHALNDDARRRSVVTRQAKAASNAETLKAKAMLAALYASAPSMSMPKAAEMLNASGFRTPSGRAFDKSSVRRLRHYAR